MGGSRSGKSSQSSMGKPHAVLVPFPAQGHVLPLMELSHRLVDRGFRVTFVCTEFDHARIVASMQKEAHQSVDGIRLLSVPDGLDPDDDRGDLGRLCAFVLGFFEHLLEDLMRKINEREEDKIFCVIADLCVSAVLSVPKKMGIPAVGFWGPSVGNLALCLHMPKLIESGIMSNNGEVLQDQIIQLSPAMPEMTTSYFIWNCFSDPITKKNVYLLLSGVSRAMTVVDGVLCNSFPGIEAPALSLIPQAIPIGPLLSNYRVTKLVGHFWTEDSSCLSWLDQQQDSSVIYVAFGSFTIINQTQFDELASGLEHTGRPFLWVVRPNLMSGSTVVYPENFLGRLADRGKIVSWAPQQKVLAHPAVACFLSHCGWNSTTEGLSNGVPFLCWPYFGDQFLNKKYICDVWNIGIELKPDENGIITRGEVQKMVKDLLCDEGIKTRAMKMKEMAEEAVSSGGISEKFFDGFVEGIKRD
ncbi:UDP-glycosyltransferase 83A1-like [Aristolochia californica]|uniref:UDP-glycosyltransferase 83A1-like n=1 Tax=Aristolochia californica TaxID=171875 RepID=UPI0035E3559D